MNSFTHKKIIKDFRKERLRPSACKYKWKAIHMSDNYDVWIKYLEVPRIKDGIFNLKDIKSIRPKTMIYLRDSKQVVESYRYNGNVIVMRRIVRNHLCDFLLNINEIEADIKEIIDKSES